jgi:hypothetical protein
MTNDLCSYCGGNLGMNRIESAGGGFRHYSKMDCCDVLMIQRNAYKLALQNMVGYFGGAEVRLLMGKAFQEGHYEALRIAKAALESGKENG